MAFAAPMLVEGAAAGSTAAAASAGAGEAGAAGAGRAATGGATSARTARSAPPRPTKTAATRAGELSGQPRYKARRTLRDEFGATNAEADDLLDAAGGRPSSPPADDKPAGDGPERGSGSSPTGAQRSWSPPKAIAGPAVAGGGLVLGVLTYMAGLVFIRGGWAGLRAWGAAKFLNRVSGESISSGPTATRTAPAQPDGALRVMAQPGKPAIS